MLAEVVLCLSAKWSPLASSMGEFLLRLWFGCPLLFSFSVFDRAHFEGMQLKFTCIRITSDNAQYQRKSSGAQDT